MKGKKLLAVTMAALMTTSSVGATVVAEEITNNIENSISVLSATNNLEALTLDKIEAENNMVEGSYKAETLQITLGNVGRVENSMTVKLYNDDNLLSTTTAADKRLHQDYTGLSVTVITNGDAEISSSWVTTLDETDWYGKTPNKMVINIDGTTKEFPISTIVSFDEKYSKMEIGKLKVAEVNGVSYSSLQKAIDAAQNKDTITLVDNITIDVTNKGYIYYATIDGKKLTIDLNGKTIGWNIQYATPNDRDWDVVFMLQNEADVTITGNGKVDCDFGVGSHGSLAFVKGSSKLTIENGEFTSDDNIIFIYNNGGEVVVNDGKFSSSNLPAENAWLLNVSGSAMEANKKFIVNGGTFVDYDPRYSNDGNKVATGYAVSKIGNEYIVIPESEVVSTVTNATNDRVYSYTSLKDAIANANAGETVTLTKNANGDGVIIDKDITIDLNGFKYTVDGNLVASDMNRASIGLQLLKGNGETANNITFKNGEIIASENATAGSYFSSSACTSSNAGYKNGVLMLMQNYANLTLDNVRLYGNKGNGGDVRATQYVISNNNGNTTIKNSEINGIAGEYAFDVWGFGSYDGTKVTVDDSIVRGLVQLGGTAGKFELVSGENSYIEAGDYVQKDDKFVAISERSIDVLADKEEVKAGEEVKVTVKLTGDKIALAKYKLSYNKDYFTLIDEELEDTGVIEFSKNKGSATEFATGEILATYTFKARAQREEVTGSFELSNTEAYTFEEARLGLDFATQNNNKVDVKIVLDQFTAIVKVDNAVVEGNEKEIAYDGKKHKVAINVTPKDYKEIKCTYKFNGEEVMGEPDFKEIGEYEINYTVVTPDGYKGLEGRFTLKITTPSAYYVEVNTSTEDGKSADYVAGKKLVLVYTDLDGVAFKYGDYDMINVSKVYNEYEYTGTETTKTNFKYVYAYVADATDENTLDSYKQHVTPFVVEDGYKIYKLDEYNEDINLNEKIEDQDATTENGVYGVHNDYFTFKTPTDSTLKQLNILKADVNGDKTVDPKDVQRVHLAVTSK